MRGGDGSRPTGQVRRQALVAAAALAAAAAALAAGALAGADGASDTSSGASPAPVALTVTARASGPLVLSRASVPAGAPVAVTFVNRAPAAHVLQAAGRSTAQVAPGGSATLTVTFPKAGTAVLSCPLAGHAAKGERATLRIAAAPSAPARAPAPAPTTPAPAPAATPTVPAGALALAGDPAAGRALWLASDCGTCHALAATGSTGSTAANLDLMKPTREALIQATALGTSEATSVMRAYPLTAQELANLAAFVDQATHAAG